MLDNEYKFYAAFNHRGRNSSIQDFDVSLTRCDACVVEFGNGAPTTNNLMLAPTTKGDVLLCRSHYKLFKVK